MKFMVFLAIVSIVNANTLYDFNNDDYDDVKNSRNFTGKVVLVTGSYSRIGSQIVKLFSALGAQLALTGRNAQELKNISLQVEEISPRKLKPLEVVADLNKDEDLQNLIDQTIKTYGKLDVLVNNAANFLNSGIRDKDFMQVFDSTIQTNLRSVVELIHLSVPYLEETNGTIISLSCVPFIVPKYTAYATTKAGVDMMTKVLALELGPKVRVNAISPGVILNNDEKEEEEADKEYIMRSAFKRHGYPIDIAKGVVFLASTDAEFITGANLYIDGGLMQF